MEDISIRPYSDESDLPAIVNMIAADLSEPYSVYVYRYFIHQWPELCFVVRLFPAYPPLRSLPSAAS